MPFLFFIFCILYVQDDSAGLSNRRGCMLRLECFVASIVSGEVLFFPYDSMFCYMRIESLFS